MPRKGRSTTSRADSESGDSRQRSSPCVCRSGRSGARAFGRRGRRRTSSTLRAVVFSGLTPAAGITGELVDIGSASAREIEGKDLDGKIVLVKRDVYMDYPDIWLTDRLAPMRIAGMIFYSTPRRSGIPTVYFNFKARGSTSRHRRRW